MKITKNNGVRPHKKIGANELNAVSLKTFYYFVFETIHTGSLSRNRKVYLLCNFLKSEYNIDVEKKREICLELVLKIFHSALS